MHHRQAYARLWDPVVMLKKDIMKLEEAQKRATEMIY